MEAFIGLLGIIVGAAIAGGFMYFKDKQQHAYEKAKANRELLLQKYEEIYENLSEYAMFAQEISVQMISEAGYGDKFDAKKLQTNLKNNKLRRNIMFYAPQLMDQVKEIDAKHAVVGRALAQFIMADGKTEKEKLTGEAAIASTELANLTGKAQESLANLVTEQINA